MFTIPYEGPFGCFDRDGLFVVCVEESKNMIIRCDMDGKNVVKYSLPSSLNCEHYLWVKMYIVGQKFILGLLKRHSDKSFHLVSIRMNHENSTCSIVRLAKTRISSHGLKVESHRSMSQIVFSICNTKWEKRKPPKKPCDRESFMLQLQADSLADKNIAVKEEEPKKVEDSRSTESETEEKKILESVLLLVRIDANGEIVSTVLSTGRRRYGIKIRRATSFREVRKSLKPKFMTRWNTQFSPKNACDPFLWGNDACLLFRDDPASLYITHTVFDPKKGIFASLINKLNHRFRKHTHVIDPVRNKIQGTAPDRMHIWSNVDIIQGCPTFLTMDPTTLKVTKWRIYRDVHTNFKWEKKELDIEAVVDTNQIMFRCNSDQLSSLELIIRYRSTVSVGSSHFHHILLND